MRRWWIGMLAGLMCGASASAQSTQPATGPATPAPATMPAHDAAFWDSLMQHLALAAQVRRDLKTTTPADRAKLRALVAAATEPEIKAQLLARLETLNEQAALDLEPLSIDVKDASLSDVVTALQGMHIPIGVWPPNGNGPPGRFTLKATGKTFWEIFSALSEQNPLRIQNFNGLRLELAQPGFTHYFAATPLVAVFPVMFMRSSSFDPQRAEGKELTPPTLTFAYAVGIDPRLTILRYSPPVLEEARDDVGNNLVANVQDNGSNLWDAQQGQCIFEQSTSLAVPSTIGKKLVSAKGHFTFQVQLAEEVVEVNPKEVLNKPIKIGDGLVTISNFSVQGTIINFQIQASNADGTNPVGISFVDANGQVIWGTRTNGGTGGGVSGQFVEPVKVRLTRSKKTRTMTVPFEMKDLPLP